MAKLPGEGLSDDQISKVAQIGQLMGDPSDDFDREVQRLHTARHKKEIEATDYDGLYKDFPHEAGYQKMEAARTGGSLVIGPTEMEQTQVKQRSALGQQAAAQGAQQAQAAQAQEAISPTGSQFAPSAPSTPAGVTQPYPAQANQPPPPSGPPSAPQAQEEQNGDQA